MSYIKIIIHCVWSTKQRIPYLTDKHVRYELFEHILQNSKQKGIYIDYIGGEKEHVHCLISLGSEQTIAKAVQLIKGESSFWINKKYNMNLQ